MNVDIYFLLSVIVVYGVVVLNVKLKIHRIIGVLIMFVAFLPMMLGFDSAFIKSIFTSAIIGVVIVECFKIITLKYIFKKEKKILYNENAEKELINLKYGEFLESLNNFTLTHIIKKFKEHKDKKIRTEKDKDKIHNMKEKEIRDRLAERLKNGENRPIKKRKKS